MRSIITWFIKNQVAANLLLLLILAGGLLSLLTMKVELFPEVSPDQIQISVEYRGASPQEIEESVIRPIEERIASLSGIDRIVSVAREGQGSILVEVLEGWDVHELFNDIKTEVDGLTTLPREAERPIVKRVVLRQEVLNLALYGDTDRETLKYWTERVKDRLLDLPGITEVDYYGVLPREIHIEIPEKSLRKYGLSLDQIAELISRESLDVAAGRLKNPREEFLVHIRGRRYFADEYRRLRLFGGRQGGTVHLSALGEVREELRDSRDYAIYYQGKPAAVIEVFRVGDQNVLRLARTVKENLPRIRAELPEGLHLEIMRDRTEILVSRIKLLVKNMLFGMILVTVLLSFFLHLNLAFWVILGIPLSFAFALWVMPHLGLSLNMISLFAFILVLGIVVDDAIVVGENVFHRRERGAGRLAAAVEGTLEVALPVTFSVLTTMAAFWPLFYGVGAMGRFIRVIPAVVILVLAGSLLEALFILPAHLYEARLPRKAPPLSRPLEAFVYGPFKGFLLRALDLRWFTAATLTALLLVVFSLWLGGRLRFTFFPKVEGNRMVATLRMPPGTPIERTLQTIRKVEAAGIEVVRAAERRYGRPLLQYSVISAGSTIVGPHGGPPELGSHIAAVEMRLVPLEKRPGISTRDLVSAWRKEVGDLPEAESLTFSGELFSMGKAISVALSHHDEGLLRAAVEDLKSRLRKIQGLHDVEDSLEEGKEELRFRLKPEAQALGIGLLDVARTVRAAFYGAEALRFQRGEDEISVLVRLPRKERSTLETLKHLRVRNTQGLEVPLLEVAEPYFAPGYIKLERLNRRRVIYVRAEVDERVLTGSEARKLLKQKVLPELSLRYPGLSWSFEGEGREEARTMRALKKEFLLALIFIYILLAIPLRSFGQPLLIMLAIPFGIVGAFLGHLLLGYQLSILSFFGIVGLAGVVVNDALILVDLANRLRAEGKPLRAVVEKATLRRFRPVILTTLTTFFGLLPMIFEKSLQARFLIPMALSLAFGVLFATAITLLLIPCGYLILEDLRAMIRRS
ncbi:efflux RND transporter permease subunit [Thermosulfurimonas marina]|uniref:Efflux RND transporter permease subunit n=1 Tax=Thermosulfurimonas marina TaxID=2047767 RepID=A0A6H1WQ77_9BACT|nr:efflux RND transporter permease subunit [Thermosulfurimonas marina]QJA05352.1 efflux RND transporter permease subunit [Thermosulfurimonas marina]